MELDITNFLPKYPNAEKQKDADIFNLYNTNFYESIYNKKEFYDNRLKVTEDFPENAGDLMNHQKLIARFFSSHTPYNTLLLVHEMGSGKSCSAIGAVEQIRAEKGGFRHALYLAKGDALVNNFINELIFKCTDGRYIPEDYEKLTELEKTHRKKKAIRDFYSTNTFETFAKEILKSRDNDLRKRYNNTVIIIDEVHNLRMQSKEVGLNVYNQFLRFLHVIQDCKILLLSGTPMKDGVDELASVLNLLLPLNDQLPTGEEFIDGYFDENNGKYKVKKNKIPKLKRLFKGRISYLKSMQSDIHKVFAGEHYGKLEHLKIVTDQMSEFQSNAYNIAYQSDRTERKGVYSKSRQASLFVFPDGSFGEEGFKKYTRKVARNKSTIGDDGKKRVLYNYVLESSLRKEIYAETHEEMLQNLKKFSSKYTESIRNILQAQKKGKSVFVYNEYVQGSGLILFGLILELFGFSRANGSEALENEKSRYASLTNLTATTRQVRKLVDRFNKSDNMHGKIINVIMGSRKIAEGFSLQNVQIEEIHTPWYNYSETAQAIARGYRLGSHRMLLETGIVPRVTIYQRVSIPVNSTNSSNSTDKNPSIDLEMYEISEIKDISIKGVERIMKESAWDCALSYNRNYITGYDGERECDYMDCEYTCDGVSLDMINTIIPNKKLDYSTFQLYYANSNIRKIIDNIILLFRNNFRMDLKSIAEHFPTYSEFELITALRTIINESIQVTNKYGYPSYIKEENNIFFLVDSLSVVGRFSSDYYTKFPHVRNPITYSQVVKPLYIRSLPKIVKQINNVQNLEDVRKIMNRLPKQVHEYFIEASILARKKDIKMNEFARDLVLEYFSNYYDEFDNVWVSWLLYDDEELIRCLKKNNWKDCGPEYGEKIGQAKRQVQVDLEQNKYGYYGQFNRKTNDFCIRDVSNIIPEKKHLRTSGKRCQNWNKTELFPVILNKLKLPIPDESQMEVKELNKWNKIKKLNKNEIWQQIMKGKYSKININVKDKDKLSRDDLLRILFWTSQQVAPACKYLRNWFDKKGLMVEDPGCGIRGKLKPE